MKKIAIVTEGTRGIGGGISKAPVTADCVVTANCNSGAETAKKFPNETEIPTFCRDVSDAAACERGIAEVCELFEGGVDVLVNNSGIPAGRFGRIEEIANAVLFLADEKSSFIPGTALGVNGGQYL